MYVNYDDRRVKNKTQQCQHCVRCSHCTCSAAIVSCNIGVKHIHIRALFFFVCDLQPKMRFFRRSGSFCYYYRSSVSVLNVVCVWIFYLTRSFTLTLSLLLLCLRWIICLFGCQSELCSCLLSVHPNKPKKNSGRVCILRTFLHADVLLMFVSFWPPANKLI